MKITIGKFDRETRTVPVTFEHGGVTHERTVNACLGEDGRHDRAATVARVDQVANGVAHKIAIGAIVDPPAVEPGADAAPPFETDYAPDTSDA